MAVLIPPAGADVGAGHPGQLAVPRGDAGEVRPGWTERKLFAKNGL